ncbi:alpha/beta hydrolase family protein [Sphingobacterium sp. LRF_L2]|uniref:alpha/beta hydrolase family protein n=1 Tax=Sphingobacterium sp. LRF_L2 TaxID=3369421 RepID=UPI003F5ECEFC
MRLLIFIFFVFQSSASIAQLLTYDSRLNINSSKNRKLQTPVPPYDYDTLNVAFFNDFDQTRLVGTLSVPRGQGRFPAVVLVTGSGPQDRDETIEGHKPFKVIADYLTKRGIIVLRYDERGIGASSGNYINSNIGDFSKDVISAVDFIRKQHKVAVSKIGVIGHSEGGLIAELIAGQGSSSINFIGSLAGPAISVDSLLLIQAYEIGKVSGMNNKELSEARNINRRNFSIIKGNLNTEQAYRKILANMYPIIPNPTVEQRDEFKMMLLPSFRYFMRIDPVPFIRKIDIPVFAAFGTKDVQVPFAANLESLTDNLPSNRSHFFKVYEGLNHLFQHASSGAVSEYAEIEETFAPEVLLDLATWINQLK